MRKYIDLLLVKPDDSYPVLVEAPVSTVSEGDIVFFTAENYGRVISSEWVDLNAPIYSMIREATVVYEAIKVYSCRCKWEKQDEMEAENGEAPGSP